MVNKNFVFLFFVSIISCNNNSNHSTEIKTLKNRVIVDSLNILNLRAIVAKIECNSDTGFIFEYSFDIKNAHKIPIEIELTKDTFMLRFNRMYHHKDRDWGITHDASGHFNNLGQSNVEKRKILGNNEVIKRVKIYTGLDYSYKIWNRIDSFGIGIPYMLNDSTKLYKNIFLNKNIIKEVSIDSFIYLKNELKIKSGCKGL